MNRRHTRALLTLLLVSFAISPSGLALAQAPPLPPPAAPLPPDLVQMKNGGLIRGTILVLLPGDHVEIQTASGERHRVAMKDVDYAGPAGKAPGAPPPYPPAPVLTPGSPAPRAARAEVSVRLRSDEPLTFFLQTGKTSTIIAMPNGFATINRESNTLLCPSPCEVSLPPGGYTFAASRDDGRPAASKTAVLLDRDSLVTGTYVSHQASRLGGLALALGGISFGLVAVLYGGSHAKNPTVPAAAGLGVLVVSSIVGIALLSRRDELSVEVTPLSLATAPTGQGPQATPDRLGRAVPEGLALTATF